MPKLKPILTAVFIAILPLNAFAQTDTRSNATGLNTNTNANIVDAPGISQDFSSKNNTSVNNEGDVQTYIAPDNFGPDANNYRFIFHGSNSGQKLEFQCPSTGGVAFNIGTFLGGFGVSTPSGDVPKDCRELVTQLSTAIGYDLAIRAAENVDPQWKKAFYEEILLKFMVDNGLARGRTNALIKLYGFEPLPITKPWSTHYGLKHLTPLKILLSN